MASVRKEEPKVGGITHSLKHLTPALISVLLTLPVATGGHEGNQKSVG
jgi:hypothetical protein